jgi:hypothetical protein
MEETTNQEDDTCSEACPVCCPHFDGRTSVAVIEANSEASWRDKSLTFSSGAFYVVLFAHIAFQAVHQTLVLPDMVYAAILSPFLGAAGEQIFERIKEFMAGRKK